MKALSRISILAVLMAFMLNSCEKDRKTRPCEDTRPIICQEDSGKVNVRIQNFTNLPVCDFRLRHVRDTMIDIYFGSVPVGGVSCFVAVDSALLGAGIRYTVGIGDFNGLQTSASFEKGFKTFITYNVFLDKVLDTNKTTGVVTEIWKTFQIPVVEKYP